MKQKKPRILAAVLLCLLAVGVLFGVYVGDYYHADTAAEAALLSDDGVTVTQENGSWVFAPDTPTAGLIFYPGGKVESTANLTGSRLRVYSTYGSEDGVLNREKYETDRSNLPANTTEVVIDSGCHAGFGSYGPQAGDGTPTISGEDQQQQTADALAAWMIQYAKVMQLFLAASLFCFNFSFSKNPHSFIGKVYFLL